MEDNEALLEGLFASIHPVRLGNSWNGSRKLMSGDSSLLNTFSHSQACVLQKYPVKYAGPRKQHLSEGRFTVNLMLHVLSHERRQEMRRWLLLPEPSIPLQLAQAKLTGPLYYCFQPLSFMRPQASINAKGRDSE